MSKRKESDFVACNTRSKKPKLSQFQPLEYLSASSCRNFMLNDSLVDWLKEYSGVGRGCRGCRGSVGGGSVFVDFIMEKGIEFERELVKYINRKIEVVSVSEFITDESVQKTIDLMMAGTPIIHSAPIRNSKNCTHGVIDFLVRSDFLHKLVNECPLTPDERIIPSPKLKQPFHYVVIDAKFSTLPLRADGRHLLNSGSYAAYKAQCLIYTDAISLIQGYKSQYAFILGRRWKYVKNNIKYNNFTCLDKLGVIDFKKIDKSFIKRTDNALKWVRHNKQFGHLWSVSPPSRVELYPNMCCDSGKWQSHKHTIADDIGEISNIWYCGVKQRNIGLSKGISSWKDVRCVSKNIGVFGQRAPIIDAILNINRQDTVKIIPNNIKNNISNWKSSCNEIFIDFETLSDIFCSFEELPLQRPTDMIFMIGVYWKRNTQWEYKSFICKKPTFDEEYRIMSEFKTFVNKQQNPKLWYWCAERL